MSIVATLRSLTTAPSAASGSVPSVPVSSVPLSSVPAVVRPAVRTIAPAVVVGGRHARPAAGAPGRPADRAAGGEPTPERLSGAGLAVVLLGTFLALVDYFVVNVALPTIGSELHASTSSLELVVAGYGIAYALLLVIGGRLGDQFGRRRVFVAGLAGFTLTRLVCAFAPTPEVLVAARIVQGASAALLAPQVLATIQATTTGARRARALGFFGATAGLAMVVGQLLGGVLVTADVAGSGWRPIFLVLVPVGVAAMLLARRFVPETRAHRTERVDVRGTVLLAAALLALLVPLTQGRDLGWPAWSVAALVAMPVLAVAFAVTEIRAERRGRAPLVPPSLLRLPTFGRGLLVAVPFFAAFGGFMFIFPVAVQEGAHLGPLQAGLALAPYAGVFLVVSLASSRLYARFGRSLLVVGALVDAVGMAGLGAVVWLTWPHLDPMLLAVPALVAGAGQAAVMPPFLSTLLSGVPADRAGTGSGVFTTTQQVSLALGVALFGAVFAALGALPGGMRLAFVGVLALEVVLLAAVAVALTRLPRPAA